MPTTTIIDELGEFEWSYKVKTFTNDGELALKEVVYDDGDTKLVSYSADGGKTVTKNDVSDSAAWDSKVINYDEFGFKESTVTQLDNTDEVITLFSGANTPARRLRVDNDDSSPWYAREFLYDDDGNHFDTIFYNQPDGLPDVYDEFFQIG